MTRATLYPTALSTSLLLFVSFGCSPAGNVPSATALDGVNAQAVAARTQAPCDIFAAATPCAAAYSTTRALYQAYNGSLYQVTRKSDATTFNVGLLSDGYANAASQDTFCASTTCTISKIFDQSPNHNNLTVAPPGGAATGAGPNGYDLPAMAAALPVTAGGHKVYGIYIMPGMGYRNDTPTGIAIKAQPEGEYMVSSTLQLDGKCCFDFGNAETDNRDDGAAAMDAINIGCPASSDPCDDRTGLDLENGVYGDLAIEAGIKFATVMGANDGVSTYTLWQGNEKANSVTTTGPLALPSGYAPMKKQGAIILGIGGDNSDGDAGYFFEGAMTTGTPTNAVMTAVHSNIFGVAYDGL